MKRWTSQNVQHRKMLRTHYVIVTKRFVTVYVLWRCTLCDVNVLKTLRFQTLALCAATFCNITSCHIYIMLLYVIPRFMTHGRDLLSSQKICKYGLWGFQLFSLQCSPRPLPPPRRKKILSSKENNSLDKVLMYCEHKQCIPYNLFGLVG